ncbi:MAG: polyketide cyclase [Xanthomonadaceae bacterium]|jgi:hypothetical protein|nr:polyketide cyclase [Xanthomonadaceae bacterium]
MIRFTEFLFALGIVAVLFLVIGLMLPSHRHLSESMETNRKMTIVYDTVNNLRRFKDWNPLVRHDPQVQLTLSGEDFGVGSRLDYDSKINSIGRGSWEIIESIPNQKVVFRVEDPSRGNNKRMTFLLEPTGRNNRNVRITQTYDVDYGMNLFGRYAGLYVRSTVGDDMKLGLHKLTEILTQIPNIDYRAEDSTLRDLRIVDLPAEDLLIVNAGNIERSNDTIKKSINDNQEWIRRVMAANELEAAGPLRVITTDFGAEKYAFDVAIPVRRKPEGASVPSTDASIARQEESPGLPAAPVAAVGELLKVTIPSGTPVTYQRTEPGRSAFASYTGHMASLDMTRNAVRAWAMTHGYDVTERPYDVWKNGVDKAFTAEGEYDIYWRIK